MTNTLTISSPSKRQQILEAAIHLFLQNGYQATGMNQLALESGVTKQTIYSHFGNKEGLFTAIIEELTIGHFKDQSGQISLSGEPESVLRGIANHFATLQKDPRYLALLRVVIAESERFPELARLYTKTVIVRGTEVFKSYFNSHPELGIKDPTAVARIYCGSLVSLIIQQELLYGKEIQPFEMKRLVDCLIAMVLKKHRS